MRPSLVNFFYLQVLDLMTTVAFLHHGVQEGNPVVRAAMGLFTNPLLGLVLVKIFAVSIGMYCWLAGRERLLVRVNCLFAAVVAWNIVAIIFAP